MSEKLTPAQANALRDAILPKLPALVWPDYRTVEKVILDAIQELTAKPEEWGEEWGEDGGRCPQCGKPLRLHTPYRNPPRCGPKGAFYGICEHCHV